MDQEKIHGLKLKKTKMKTEMYKDFDVLKSEIADNQTATVLNFLNSLSIVLNASTQAKIQELHHTYKRLEDDNISGVLTSENYTANINRINRSSLETIEEMSAYYSIQEFEKAIEFSKNYNKGSDCFDQQEWENSLNYLTTAQQHYIPKFENALFDLETKLFLTKANINLAKHKAISNNVDKSLASIFKNNADTILESNTFKNQSLMSQIILDNSTLEFRPILKGQYQNTKIDRVYKKVKVPQLKNINEIINNGISQHDYENVIEPNAIPLDLNASFTFVQLEEKFPLKIYKAKEKSYHFFSEEIVSDGCTNCGGKGSNICSEPECNNGKQKCTTCEGIKQENCHECNGSKKITCTNCDGKETKSCTSCNNGINKAQCNKCKGIGVLKNNCETCTNTRIEECTTCDKGGKIPCKSCTGFGESDCTTCKGKGTKKCEVCKGSGGVFTIPLIETKLSNFSDHFLYAFDQKNNKLLEIKPELREKLMASSGYKSSNLEVLSFFRSDGYKVDFSVEKKQTAIRNKYRQQTKANHESIYPILTKEKIVDEILPCFKITYSFIFNASKKYDLYIPLSEDAILNPIFEKKPNLEKISARSNFKTKIGRAFSTKKQLEIDDKFKQINLMVHLAKTDNELDFTEKTGLSTLLTGSINHFTKDSQNVLLKRIRNEESMTSDTSIYRFSKQENGIKAFDEIVGLMGNQTQKENVSKEVEKMKKQILDASPKNVAYVKNLLSEPMVSVALLLLIIVGILSVYFIVA